MKTILLATILEVISHRGVHQALRRDRPIDPFECTAGLIEETSHNYFENTIPSIRAAFEAGANVVEIDLHLTADGDIAVFHDFDLRCRTDAEKHACKTRNWRGKDYCFVEDHDMAFLKKLDVAYHYSSDNGKTFPFRGQGIGLIPSLREIFDTFPDKSFLLDYKGDRGDTFSAIKKIISSYPESLQERLAWYDLKPEDQKRALDIAPKSRIIFGEKAAYKSCFAWLFTTGWFSFVPESCRNMAYGLPMSVVRKYPRLSALAAGRSRAIGSPFILVTPETVEDMKAAEGLHIDGIFTNHVELLGPYVKASSASK